MPYLRGFVFAIYLNSLIKENSPRNSLDNVMFDLFKNAKQKRFSSRYFSGIVENYVSQVISQEISLYINQGQTIKLDDAAKFLPIKKIKMGSFCPGFDIKVLLKERVIHKIDKKSNAYKIGLRNGDKVVSYNFPDGNSSDQIVTIETKHNTFKFRPESPDNKLGWQFRTELSPKEKAEIKKFFG